MALNQFKLVFKRIWNQFWINENWLIKNCKSFVNGVFCHVEFMPSGWENKIIKSLEKNTSCLEIYLYCVKESLYVQWKYLFFSRIKFLLLKVCFCLFRTLLLSLSLLSRFTRKPHSLSFSHPWFALKFFFLLTMFSSS